MTPSPAELPDLSGDYPLTAEQIAEFQQNGHILLRGVCSPEEVAAYRPILTGTVYRSNTQALPLEERDTYGKAFIQIGNLWLRDDGARKFVFGRRFAKIAGELMGVDAVRFYHDQALYKEAGGGLTPWHQDQYYWPMDTNKTVTMWMPLVDVSIEMGALTFASGSHKGYLGHLQISDDSQDYFDQLVQERGFPVVHDAMQAGDATFHAGWTLHSAPGNSSDTAREVMTIIYYADGVRIMAPIDNPARQSDCNHLFPGVKAGELAVSRLTPLLYRKGKR